MGGSSSVTYSGGGRGLDGTRHAAAEVLWWLCSRPDSRIGRGNGNHRIAAGNPPVKKRDWGEIGGREHAGDSRVNATETRYKTARGSE